MIFKKNKNGFSLAEALITLIIVSLVIAAVIPVMSKKQNTVDAMWRYASNNSDIYFANNTSQTAVIGAASVPSSAKGNRLTIVAQPEDTSKSIYAIQRSLIDFYQLNGLAPQNTGRISFDSLSNTAVGKETLIKTYDNGTTDAAFGNAAFGAFALAGNTVGMNNSALGYQSLYKNSTDDYNTAMGSWAFGNLASGSNNTGLGYCVGNSLTSGSNNTLIGYNALYGNTSGSNNIAIGNYAGNNSSGSNKLYIEANGLAYGASGALVYGEFDTRRVYINGQLYANGSLVSSDARLKNIGSDNKAGIEKILALNVKNYTYKNDKTNRPRVGVIAQDLQKVFPNSVVRGNKGHLYIDTSEMFYAAINSIKQLHSSIISDEERISKLEIALKNQQEQINSLKQQNLLLMQQLDQSKHKKSFINKK